MIVMERESTCDVRSYPMPPKKSSEESPEVTIEIRFINRRGGPLVLNTQGFTYCSLEIFADPSPLYRYILPDILSLMASNHTMVFDGYLNFELWKQSLFAKLFSHAQRAWNGRWAGLVLIVDIQVSGMFDDGALIDWVTEQSQMEFRGIPASDSAIGSLPKKIFREDDHVTSSSCAICMDDFMAGEELTEMPCSHSFHGDCITTWLKNSGVCPLCRFRISGEEDFLQS